MSEGVPGGEGPERRVDAGGGHPRGRFGHQEVETRLGSAHRDVSRAPDAVSVYLVRGIVVVVVVERAARVSPVPDARGPAVGVGGGEVSEAARWGLQASAAGRVR